ncbi:hypothetical protein FKP32DRAFT_1598225 [Trametes sanguinea]|nr:hypothetical protein FKP32DRAFT_1598225 [Trametes sanguinea]
MKAIFALAALVASAVAQKVIIASPPPLWTLHPGQSFVVDVDHTPSLTPSQDVAVAIGIQSCSGNGQAVTCPPNISSGNIGTPLFRGIYNPQLLGNGHTDLVQNYTVTVPSGISSGPALLSVAHFGLIMGTIPFLEVVNQTVIIG